MDALEIKADTDHHVLLEQALRFAVQHEDGVVGSRIREADMILVGQSRVSKTPTALYLAWKFRKLISCVPFVHGIPLPIELDEEEQQGKIIVLDISPDRLLKRRELRIREYGNAHVPMGYVDLDAIKAEQRALRRHATERYWRVINVTNPGIEETATQIGKHFKLRVPS